MKPISSLSRIEREKARLRAGTLFRKGIAHVEIARRLKATPAAVSQWHTAWKNGGRNALRSKGHSGFASKLNAADRQIFKRAVLKGPLAYGYPTNLWTIPRLAEVMKKSTGVRFSEVWTWHIVRELGFTPQKPELRARERDEAAIQDWKTCRLPGLKKMGSSAWVLSGL